MRVWFILNTGEFDPERPTIKMLEENAVEITDSITDWEWTEDDTL